MVHVASERADVREERTYRNVTKMKTVVILTVTCVCGKAVLNMQSKWPFHKQRSINEYLLFIDASNSNK